MPPESGSSGTSATQQRINEYMARQATKKLAGANYCYRHRPDRARDPSENGGIAQMQEELQSLPASDKNIIQSVWELFGSAPSEQRQLLLRGMLAQCCFPQLSMVAQTIRELVRIDFIVALPVELAFKILGYLDAKSLSRAAQVSKSWQKLASDDIVWYHLCEQHIDRKCTTCGWGLPLLERRRLRQTKQDVMQRIESLSTKRSFQEMCAADEVGSEPKARPWKDIYIERYKIENNWRTGRQSIKEFKQNSPVLCLQFDEQYLITGTYDGNITIWDVESCVLVRRLRGHFRAVSALKFDATKLVSASWDQSVRVWNYRTGQCLCTFGGHDSKVLCVDFDHNLIAAGSADSRIKVWDFEQRSCFTLQGHTGSVHSVRIHDASQTLYTSSEDLTVRMWDLRQKTCLKILGGPENGPAAHIAQIQQALPITLHHLEGEEDHQFPQECAPELSTKLCADSEDELFLRRPTHLLTASLDNTIKLWDIRTGRCARTLFGHVEGVWCIAADHFRIVSGAHDKLIKVWDLQSGKCWHTFSGHTKPVCCVWLNETGFASGGDDGMVKLYNFDI